MLKSLFTILAVFLLIKLFFPELASGVQRVLELALQILTDLLSQLGGRLPPG